MIENGCQSLIRKYVGLEDLLQLATSDELRGIADILLDSENDRFFGNTSKRERLSLCYKVGELHKAVNEMAFEIRSLGSVNFINFTRGGEPVGYDEVVRDVAGEFKVQFSKTDSTPVVEGKILEALAVELENNAPYPSEKSVGISKYLRRLLRLTDKGKLKNKKRLGIGDIVAVGILPVMNTFTIGILTAGLLADRMKDRPELSSLARIVVELSRIRAEIVAVDHEDFAKKLRGCL